MCACVLASHGHCMCVCVLGTAFVHVYWALHVCTVLATMACQMWLDGCIPACCNAVHTDQAFVSRFVLMQVLC
jgi:hypothetical protein